MLKRRDQGNKEIAGLDVEGDGLDGHEHVAPHSLFEALLLVCIFLPAYYKGRLLKELT